MKNKNLAPILKSNIDQNSSQFQENKSFSKVGFINNPYQMVERDFAFLFPKEVKAGEIIKKVKKIVLVTCFKIYKTIIFGIMSFHNDFNS